MPSLRLIAPSLIATAILFCLMGRASAGPFWTELDGSVRKAQAFPDFVAIAAKLSPAVVNISAEQKSAPAEEEQSSSPDQDADPFDRFGQPFEQYGLSHPHSLGSGFIINKAGYILTNDHVIQQADRILVTLQDGRQFKAHVVGHDSKTDIALIRIISKGNLPVAPLGNSDNVKVGQWVMAIGNPFGFDHSVTAGIVSAKGRFIPGNYDDFIQTDASINPGNSGGPLINLDGAVVGVNSAIYTRSGMNMGIGFAIPVNLVKQELPQLRVAGKVVRGWLGVYVEQVQEEDAIREKMSQPHGAMVSEVLAHGPAAAAGLRRGDIILEFDHHSINESQELPLLVGEVPVGRTVTIKIVRSGMIKEVPILVAPSGEEELEHASLRTEKMFGLKVESVTPELARELDLGEAHGLVVSSIAPGSTAEASGLRVRDLILEVNRKPVADLSAYNQALTGHGRGKIILLLIKRDNGTLFIPLKRAG